MNPGRLLSEHRPLAILVVLVAASLFSLATGTESSFLHRGLSRFVNITTYPFLKVRHVTMATTGRAWQLITDHEHVHRENEDLKREVTALRTRAATHAYMQQENEHLRRMLGYVREQPRLELLPVAVLESYKGMLRIDGGANREIQPSMGVISPEGVVGIVTEVADFTSTVATIHHMDCRVGAMVLRGHLRAYDGVVHASGSDLSHLCVMEYIDIKEEVRNGDWVVTSPESQFPAGLPIGRITAVRSGVGLWKSAEIAPAVDPYRLGKVFIITRAVDNPDYIAGPPAALLPKDTTRDATAATELHAPQSPDFRSLQERYAP